MRVITQVVMALLALAAIVYAAGKTDGDVMARLNSMDSRLERIERQIERLANDR